jgi:hypothetical protein
MGYHSPYSLIHIEKKCEGQKEKNERKDER